MLGGKILVGAIMTFSAFLLFLNVVLRYVFHYGMSWAEEVTRYTLLWTVFVGAGVISREGAHVSMEALYNIFPEKLQRTAFLAIHIFCSPDKCVKFAFCCFAKCLGRNFKTVFVIARDAHTTGVCRQDGVPVRTFRPLIEFPHPSQCASRVIVLVCQNSFNNIKSPPLIKERVLQPSPDEIQAFLLNGAGGFKRESL